MAGTGNWIKDLPDLVIVKGYSPLIITKDESSSFGYHIDNLIENLDENYGNPEEPSDYKLSDKAKELFDKFASQVMEEYPVWQCEVVNNVEINLKEHVREYFKYQEAKL